MGGCKFFKPPPLFFRRFSVIYLLKQPEDSIISNHCLPVIGTERRNWKVPFDREYFPPDQDIIQCDCLAIAYSNIVMV